MRLATFEQDGWQLEDGEAYNRLYPRTFHVPSAEEKAAIKPGDLVKMMFAFGTAEEHDIERMWVTVKERRDDKLIGTLSNEPLDSALEHGRQTIFETRHVIRIIMESEAVF